MFVRISLEQFCVSPRILEVSFTQPEINMIIFVCALVAVFTGKRLLQDIKKWLKLGPS